MREVWCDYWKKKVLWSLICWWYCFCYSLQKSSFKRLLNKAHDWDIKNKMILGINKWAILVAKPKNFIPLRHHKNPTIKLGINFLLNINHLIYHRIPFNKSLNLEHIITNMNYKINYTVNFFFGF